MLAILGPSTWNHTSGENTVWRFLSNHKTHKNTRKRLEKDDEDDSESENMEIKVKKKVNPTEMGDERNRRTAKNFQGISENQNNPKINLHR